MRLHADITLGQRIASRRRQAEVGSSSLPSPLHHPPCSSSLPSPLHHPPCSSSLPSPLLATPSPTPAFSPAPSPPRPAHAAPRAPPLLNFLFFTFPWADSSRPVAPALHLPFAIPRRRPAPRLQHPCVYCECMQIRRRRRRRPPSSACLLCCTGVVGLKCTAGGASGAGYTCRYDQAWPAWWPWRQTPTSGRVRALCIHADMPTSGDPGRVRALCR